MSIKPSTRKNHLLNQSIHIDLFSSSLEEELQFEKLKEAKNKDFTTISLIHAILMNNPSLSSDEKKR